MTIQELVTRFPEIPKDLHDEPTLEKFAEAFDELLRSARNPSACSKQHDVANHYYLKLIGPLSIYGYGLSTREGVLSELRELLGRYEEDPRGFRASLLPEDVVEREVPGAGCE